MHAKAPNWRTALRKSRRSVAARQAGERLKRRERDLDEVARRRGPGSPSKHSRPDVADPDRDRQRNKGLVLNKEIERLRRAVAFGSRLLTEASNAPFNLAGGVLNRVRRSVFHVLDQARDIALQRVQVLAKQVRDPAPPSSMRS